MDEFIEQVKMHKQAIKDLLNFEPKIFENTELLYNNRIAKTVEKLGAGKVVDQRWLSKKLLVSAVEEIFSSESYWRKAENLGKIASKFDALSLATKTVLDLA